MRVSSELAVMAVRRSGHRCTASTLRQWVRRGHIRRYRGDCYDLTEIQAYLDVRAA